MMVLFVHNANVVLHQNKIGREQFLASSDFPLDGHFREKVWCPQHERRARDGPHRDVGSVNVNENVSDGEKI